MIWYLPPKHERLSVHGMIFEAVKCGEEHHVLL